MATKILVTVTFLLMVVVNALANILPINGQTTGQVSDSYPNLFAPAGITFAIWGVIYLALGAFTLYQLGLFPKCNSSKNPALLEKVGFYFWISSIANAIWIFAWHYELILLSTVLMAIILLCLIMINLTINKEELNAKEKLFVRLPFSIYFGWITVATIANVTTLLVSLGWDGFGLAASLWTVIIILIGLVIGTATMIINKDIAYGLVILWAYAGILIKHLSSTGFDGQYPAVIYTVISSIVLLLIAEAYIIVRPTAATKVVRIQ